MYNGRDYLKVQSTDTGSDTYPSEGTYPSEVEGFEGGILGESSH